MDAPSLTKRVSAFLVMLLCISPVFAQKPVHTTGDFVIRNARVFDGHKILPQSDVWVERGRIKAVGKGLKVPVDLLIVDGAGYTVLPGLIDSHTHVWGTALKEALIFGVTTELDMFTDATYMAQEKKAQAEGKDLDLADLRSAGTLVTAPGGHGTEYGLKIPTLTSAADAQSFVDARIAEGSDYIKIIYDDGRMYGRQIPTLTKETLKAVIDAAHKRGKLAVVHISTQQQARDAIETGADGLAHLFADSSPVPDFAQFVASHHAFVVPTLTVLESVDGTANRGSLATDSNLEPYFTAENITNLKRAFPKFADTVSEKHAEETIRQLKMVHVPVLAGTDSPNPGTTHGASIHRELELLVRAGLTPQEALAAATSVPAAAFHLEDRGQIAPGKRADLLLVKGDPTQDITATRAIAAVWKLGVQDDRDSYRAEIEKKRQDAQQTAKAPLSPAVASGVISDFEDDKPSSKFGTGWSITTDSLAGGKSSGDMKTVDGGAQGSKKSLEVSGNVDAGLPYAWAGVMFSPDVQLFAPVNLSSKKAVTFWAKGDGKPYRVLIFTQSGGRIPAQVNFATGPEWKKISFPFTAFNTDGHDIASIMFVGGPAPGKFDFQVDDVGLE